MPQLIFYYIKGYATFFIKTHSMKSNRNPANIQLLKTQIGYENYLSQIENIQHRTALTKLRLSNHCLEIEKGRHKRMDKNFRFCPFCPNSIENEEHFMIQCQPYRALREKLFCCTKIQTNDFSRLIDQQIFIALMTDSKYIKKTASYICKCLQIREFLLKRHKNTD